MTHTPGDWKVVHDTDNGCYDVIVGLGDDRNWIAEEIDELDNARLIAAAPDLLAALKEMIAPTDHISADKLQRLAANVLLPTEGRASLVAADAQRILVARAAVAKAGG